jgi:hypothetical protein
VCSSSTGRMENSRRACSAVSNNGSHCVVLRIAYQRDPGSAMDRLRLPTVGRSDPEISSGKTPEPPKDRVFARRSPSRKQLHSCSDEVAGALRCNGRTVGLSESSNRTSVPRRLNPGRLPGSGRREAWTRQDWISYVSSQLPRVAGRNGSTHGSTAEVDATRWPVTSLLLKLMSSTYGSQLVAEFFGCGRQTPDAVLAITVFVCGCAFVHVRLAPSQ